MIEWHTFFPHGEYENLVLSEMACLRLPRAPPRRAHTPPYPFLLLVSYLLSLCLDFPTKQAVLGIRSQSQAPPQRSDGPSSSAGTTDTGAESPQHKPLGLDTFRARLRSFVGGDTSGNSKPVSGKASAVPETGARRRNVRNRCSLSASEQGGVAVATASTTKTTAASDGAAVKPRLWKSSPESVSTSAAAPGATAVAAGTGGGDSDNNTVRSGMRSVEPTTTASLASVQPTAAEGVVAAGRDYVTSAAMPPPETRPLVVVSFFSFFLLSLTGAVEILVPRAPWLRCFLLSIYVGASLSDFVDRIEVENGARHHDGLFTLRVRGAEELCAPPPPPSVYC